MKYVYKAIDFLIKPSKNFDSIKKYKLGEAFKFMLAISIVFAVLNGIIGTLFSNYIRATFGMTIPYSYELLPVMIISNIVSSYILIVVFFILWSLWQHLWAYVFGARKGIEQTIKSVFYGTSPLFLMGWIPVISIIFVIWSLALHVIGIKKLHGMNTARSALAVSIAVIISLILLLAFLISVIMMFGIDIPLAY